MRVRRAIGPGGAPLAAASIEAGPGHCCEGCSAAIKRQSGPGGQARRPASPARPLLPADLPIAQLPTEHPDPKVAAGLAAIAALDAQLRDVTAEALAASRTAFPEQWEGRERRRLERHSLQVGGCCCWPSWAPGQPGTD
jgi:hypothetical protein